MTRQPNFLTVAKRKVIHYFWLRRYQPIPTKPEDVVDTACGIETTLDRATDYMSKVTCKRCRRSRN